MVIDSSPSEAQRGPRNARPTGNPINTTDLLILLTLLTLLTLLILFIPLTLLTLLILLQEQPKRYPLLT
jgi:hypothetical protein